MPRKTFPSFGVLLLQVVAHAISEGFIARGIPLDEIGRHLVHRDEVVVLVEDAGGLRGHSIGIAGFPMAGNRSSILLLYICVANTCLAVKSNRIVRYRTVAKCIDMGEWENEDTAPCALQGGPCKEGPCLRTLSPGLTPLRRGTHPSRAPGDGDRGREPALGHQRPLGSRWHHLHDGDRSPSLPARRQPAQAGRHRCARRGAPVRASRGGEAALRRRGGGRGGARLGAADRGRTGLGCRHITEAGQNGSSTITRCPRVPRGTSPPSWV